MTNETQNPAPLWNSYESLSAVYTSWKGDAAINVPEWDQPDQLARKIRDWYEAAGFDFYADEAFTAAFWTVMRAFQPTPSKESGPELMAYNQSHDKLARGIRTPIKPGRFFKRVFPAAPDSVIAGMVDAYKRNYDSAGYTLSVHTDRASFKFGYLADNYVANQNPSCGHSRKWLGGSCMSHSFHGQQFHPAESYASGDFSIAIVKDQAGKVAARCVYLTRKNGSDLERPLYAPVYGNSDQAMDLIESHLSALNARPCGHGGYWDGARMLALPVRGDHVAFPYIDVSPDCAELADPDAWEDYCADMVDSDPQFLVLEHGGSINAGTSGYASVDANKCKCHECGDRVDDDDSRTVNGDLYCWDCYSNNFGYCENCEDDHRAEDLHSVVTRITRHGPDHSQWCESCIRCDATECADGEYYRDSLVAGETHDGQHLSQSMVESGDWFLCESSDEWFSYSDSHAIETVDGETWEESNAIARGYVEDPDGSGEWMTLESVMGPHLEHSGQWHSFRVNECDRVDEGAELHDRRACDGTPILPPLLALALGEPVVLEQDRRSFIVSLWEGDRRAGWVHLPHPPLDAPLPRSWVHLDQLALSLPVPASRMDAPQWITDEIRIAADWVDLGSSDSDVIAALAYRSAAWINQAACWVATGRCEPTQWELTSWNSNRNTRDTANRIAAMAAE